MVSMDALHQFHVFDKDFPVIALKSHDLKFRHHWHSEVELVYVVSGSLLVSVDRFRGALGPGSFAISGSRRIHSYDWTTEHSDTIVVLFKPDIVESASAWPLGGRLSADVVHAGERGDFPRVVGDLSASLLEECARKRPGFESIARGQVLRLCGLIQRELGAGEGELSPRSGTVDMLERFQGAIDLVVERLESPISLEDAAKAASLSPWYFSRSFKRTFGVGFSRFVNELRVERAERLMAESSKTLSQIAIECGFENFRTFDWAFRAIRGLSPSESRARRDRGAVPPAGGTE
jgi:AraC-like DNA-binding protein